MEFQDPGLETDTRQLQVRHTGKLPAIYSPTSFMKDIVTIVSLVIAGEFTPINKMDFLNPNEDKKKG